MKKLIAGLCLVSAGWAQAQDLVNDSFQGSRVSNGEVCVLQHRQLEYSYPELFISLHSPDSESVPLADALLVEVKGLSLEAYQAVMFGSEAVSTTASKGIYNYTIEASSSNSVRTVNIKGVSSTEGNRASLAQIVLRGNQIESISIAKQAKTFFGGWKTVFQDQCQAMNKAK